MSKYTTSLKNYCEAEYANAHPQVKNPTTRAIMSYGEDLIFDFPYPIFDTEYRSDINWLILRHFYFREIGFETMGMFKLKLEDKLFIIMPAINQMFKSVIIDGHKIFDFSDGGEKITFEEETSSENSRNVENDYNKTETTLDEQNIEIVDTNKHGENDTPQNATVSTNPDSWGINTYLSKYEYEQHKQTRRITNINSEGTTGGIKHFDHGGDTSEETGSGSGTRNYIENVFKFGDSKKNYEFLAEMENKFISIETILLDQLEPLFIQIW